MMTGERLRILPWQKGPMAAAQAEVYRKAIAPLQQHLAAAKAARREVFRALRSRNAASLS